MKNDMYKLNKIIYAFLLIAIFFPVSAFASGSSFVTNGVNAINRFSFIGTNTSYRIDSSVLNNATYSTITPNFVGPSASTLANSSGWTQVFNGNADDDFLNIPFGFDLLLTE